MTKEKKEAVLIVDDQSAWRELLAELLEDNYEVIRKGSYSAAKEALLVQDPPFHVAIVDIRLVDSDQANEDGLRLAEEINRMGEYTNAIVVTGHPTIRTAKKALRNLAVFEYLEKVPEEGKNFDYASFRKIVQQAVDEAEKKRPNSFVRKGNQILVIDKDNKRRKELIKILQQDEYEVDSLTRIQGLASKLKAKTYELLILDASFLKQDPELPSKIREDEANINIILVMDREVDKLIPAIQNREFLNVVTVKRDSANFQEFRETIRRTFAFEAKKYVTVSLKGVESTEKLQAEREYMLVLNLQDKPEQGAASIWLTPRKDKQTATILEVSTYAPGVQFPHGEQIRWEIPPRGLLTPLEIEIVPIIMGKTKITIDFEQSSIWLGRVEKEIEVEDK